MDADQGCFFFDQTRRGAHRGPLMSFISMAARFGDVDTLNKLLEEAIAADSGFLTSPTIGLALKRATQAGHVHIVRCLVEAGADINTKFKGASALHEAIKVNDLGMLSYLLSVPGMKTNTLSTAQKTPVMEAACRGRVQCLSMLLAAGCGIERRNARGQTALHYCLIPSIATIDADDMTACLDLLYQAGADINVQDNYGSTPLHVAIATENLEAVVWLLGHNCDLELEAQPLQPLAPGVFSRIERGVAMTPLLLAIHFSNRRFVQLLVACGASCHKLGWTLAYCQQYELLHEFLAHCTATPVSLQLLCRSVLRRVLKQDISVKVSRLTCLPQSVQRFLSLTHELQRA